MRFRYLHNYPPVEGFSCPTDTTCEERSCHPSYSKQAAPFISYALTGISDAFITSHFLVKSNTGYGCNVPHWEVKVAFSIGIAINSLVYYIREFENESRMWLARAFWDCSRIIALISS
ncbi:hypothetical protein NC651_001060 [Populus alba x Populus x berolinensis]|nr:hypothetical protein NC651_001060 [Populus alba x Populus x berolinensis]